MKYKLKKEEKRFCNMLANAPYKVKIKALQSFADFLKSRSDPRHKLVSAYIEWRLCKSNKQDKLYASYVKIRDKLERKFLELPKNTQRYILVDWKLAFPYEVHIATTAKLNKLGKLLNFSSTLFIGVLKLEKMDVNLVIPEWVANVSYIGKLDLSNNSLSSLNDFSGNLIQLSELNLDNNNLKKCPESVGVLQSLIKLTLSNNKLKSLPDTLCGLKKLSVLNLENNRLEKLPSEFTKLTKLCQLDLDNNQLKTIPENIDKLTKLSRLDLANNLLIAIPININKLSNLSFLDLSNNLLTEIPKAIGKLKNLEVLMLNGNELNKIPDFVWKLKKLTYLDLGENNLLDISDSIGNLKQLTVLRLSGNNLTRLPESIGKIKKLEELHLKGNNLAKIPAAINKLKRRNLQIFGTIGKKQIDNSLKDYKKDAFKSAKKMALKDSCYFYPVSDWEHMGVCAGRSKYPGAKAKSEIYNPYLIPKGDSKDEQNEINNRTLYGAMDILAMHYVSEEEWGCNEELDSIVGKVFSVLYKEASEALTKLFGKPLAEGHVESFKQTHKKMVQKLPTGDNLICTIWLPSDYAQGFYLMNSMSSGDGDIIYILWICYLAEDSRQ
ncbi:hypothetical protein MNBD_GAMMA12-867 [hydrothermal vent metagenome]|uniref:Disease resistance R13L4/SHOC-2-like LRR domain-containing protein n=1 Tax=hydrothermal vent metagenome TaxID=652676 RepID=A0A3B0Z1J2_9ZZZZ